MAVARLCDEIIPSRISVARVQAHAHPGLVMDTINYASQFFKFTANLKKWEGNSSLTYVKFKELTKNNM